MIKYLLLLINVALSGTAWAQVTIERLDSGLLFAEGDDRILFYQISGNEQHGEYRRANYVHPLYGLDGAMLTEDRPEDHPHHHGVFWAWHQLYIQGKRIGDGWINEDLEWKVISFETKDRGNAKQLVVRVDWLSPLWLDEQGNMKPVVKEETMITVYPRKKSYRTVDFSISLIATEPNTMIGGSEDPKGYGGFSPRIKLPPDISFTGPKGEVIPKTNPVEAHGWLDISGSLGKRGEQAGVSILSHSNNPGYPNPWILRSKGSMQNAVYPHPGAQPVYLSDREYTTLKYRLIIHGKEVPDLAKLHEAYSNQ